MDQSAKRPILIGITGTIGSGKSAVGRILEAQGVPVIDTDKIVHELLTADNPVRKMVIDRFGPSIVDTASGAIKRAVLGKIVFGDNAARKDLESITHPAVTMECRKRVSALSNHKVVAVLVPLLFEAGLAKEYDEVWSVIADEQTLKDRLMNRDKLPIEQIEQRIKAQWPQEKKAALATRTIDNSGSLADTERQIKVFLDQLKASTGSKS